MYKLLITILLIILLIAIIAATAIFIYNKYENSKKVYQKDKDATYSNAKIVNNNYYQTQKNTVPKNNVVTGVAYTKGISETKHKESRKTHKRTHGKNSNKYNRITNGKKNFDFNTISYEMKEEETINKTSPIKKTNSSFNPRKVKPSDVKIVELSISNDKLIPCTLGKTVYYHCWEYENRMYYDFNEKTSILEKIINNHSSIIDPFCIREVESSTWEDAKTIKGIAYGIVDENYNIIEKLIIKVE